MYWFGLQTLKDERTQIIVLYCSNINILFDKLKLPDTTVSSDTSDVEGRIELLTQKLADRRLEMARLKKEARKQAKQRLRALESNLLNQIKVCKILILHLIISILYIY